MDTLILVSIMVLMLFARSGSARAATLIVSNEMQTLPNVPVFVTCRPTPELSKSVPLGQKIMIEIPSIAGDNEKVAGSRQLSHTLCVGTFYNKKNSETYGMWFVLYDSSDKNHCKDSCSIVAKDYGFYSWNNNKKTWDLIPPRFWIN
ncbi:hypothetical protein ISN44_As05g021320 [Arabidopsis suecica]|uniref:S-protein homolog n=2 Tax=Arabidopsis TaxID=3701 RepID=A0A5S9Y6S9_ARATH|nr:hypothetical protein ISN44_As05g021320 [Arabidopsis suecica]CAA0404257.1 unnamed protein product [Arabidopsis thaliana]